MGENRDGCRPSDGTDDGRPMVRVRMIHNRIATTNAMTIMNAAMRRSLVQTVNEDGKQGRGDDERNDRIDVRYALPSRHEGSTRSQNLKLMLDLSDLVRRFLLGHRIIPAGPHASLQDLPASERSRIVIRVTYKWWKSLFRSKRSRQRLSRMCGRRAVPMMHWLAVVRLRGRIPAQKILARAQRIFQCVVWIGT